MKRLSPLRVKDRRFTAASRAAAAARATAAEAARAAAQPAETELEADEHAFLVTKLRERLALLHGDAETVGEEGANAAEGSGALSTAAAQAAGLKRKLSEISYQPPKGMRRTPWIETLAVVAPASAAAVDEEEVEIGGEKRKKVAKPIDVHADIEREAYFMRLTVAAATEGLRRLRQLRVKFTRPSDFYAEMLKSDEHMQRVRARVAEEQQHQQQFLEKKNRERNKKFHKQSGKKLLRAQEEARLRNLELKKLEAWKQQRLHLDGSSLQTPGDKSNMAGVNKNVTISGKKQKQQPHPRVPTSSSGKPATAVEAALDQWIADRENERKQKPIRQKPHTQHAKRIRDRPQQSRPRTDMKHTAKEHRRNRK